MKTTMIPMMTDPLGKYWEQPSSEAIVVDDTHAVMDHRTFDALPNYSCSQPTGVYVGRMWKRREPYHDAALKHTWYLCWYDTSEKGSAWCSTQIREVLLV